MAAGNDYFPLALRDFVIELATKLEEERIAESLRETGNLLENNPVVPIGTKISIIN